MKLKDLLSSVTTLEVSGSGNPEIEWVAYDSRQIKPGGLFVAVVGERTDSYNFV